MAARIVENTPDKQALKADARALIKAVGGTEAAEGFCRSNFRRLSEYGRPENDVFMPIDVVADLETVAHGTADYPQVTRGLARRAGYALVKLPTGVDDPSKSAHDALADSLREAGELHQALCKALADGRIDGVEAAHIERLAIDAAEADMRVAALAAQIRGA